MSPKVGKRALIIVDVQNDFCEGGSLEVPKCGHIFPMVNRISPLFPVVVGTKDWHPTDHISFASAHPGKKIHDAVPTPYGEQILWPDHCVQGSSGAEFSPQLDQSALNMVLHKGTDPSRDSYSAFTMSDGESHTGLAGYLHAHDIEQLFICGLATDFCVMATALDAHRNRFPATVVTDAIAAVDITAGSGERALQTMKSGGVQFCTVSDMID